MADQKIAALASKKAAAQEKHVAFQEKMLPQLEKALREIGQLAQEPLPTCSIDTKEVEPECFVILYNLKQLLEFTQSV